MTGWFDSNETLIQSAMIAAMLGYSVQVALRAGVFSFAGIAFYGIAAYAVGYLLTEKAWAAVPAFAVVLAATAVLGLVLGLILARLRALYLAMATLALVLLVQTGALVFDEITGGALGLVGIPPAIGTGWVAILLAVVAVLLAATQYGASGRRLLAMRTDEPLAGATGVDIRRHHLIAVVASSVIGALAGGCHAILLAVFTPENVGFPILISTLIVLVIGGVWHWSGPLIGGVVVAWLPEWLASVGEWRAVVEGAIVIFMVIFLPAGIAGLLGRARRLVPRRSSSVPAAEAAP